MNATLVVTTLTEDGSDAAIPVVQRLVKLLLQVIEPATQTHRVELKPYEQARRFVVKNGWHTGAARDQAGLTELIKYIVRILKTGPPTNVAIHHFDADEPWSESKACARLLAWERLIRTPVANHAGNLAAARLVPLVPHPEIEAWLFLHRGRLEELANQQGKTSPDEPTAGWHSLAAVQAEYWPHDAHNLDLVTGFPTERAIDASPSLRAALERLRAVPGLAEALAATVGWR